MKLLLGIILILLCCNHNLKASSKKSFQEGYIISLKGDTIKGYLLNQIGKNASEKCIFKLNPDSASITYKPDEIAGYRYLNSKYYITKEIDIDSTTKRVVFMELLISGMANILYYVDSDEHYYIEKAPVGLLELTEKETLYYKEETLGKDGAHTYIMPSKAKGKLTYILQDCPSISSEIQDTKLTHKSLIKLTKDYHKSMCNSESCIIYEKQNIKQKAKWGLLMGYSKNMYNFGERCLSKYGNNYQIGASLKVSNLFMFNENINIKANILLEKDSKSYTFYLPHENTSCEITYEGVSYNLIDYRSRGHYDTYFPSMKADINILDLKIPISLNYDIKISKKTSYTCGIGISNKIILAQNKDFKVEAFYQNYGKSVNTLLSGVIATTGIERKWLGEKTTFINASYEHLSDLRSKSPDSFQLTNNQFSLQLGIYF